MVGSLVLNRFLIERRIGSGGFGVVYEAWDGRLERTVAVKAIESRGEAGRRVLREAQAAARLNHPGIVTLYEMGEEDGNALLVTELVEGTTLARLEPRRRAQRPRDRRDRRRPLRGARPRPLARRRPPRHQAAERPRRPRGRVPRQADGLRHRPPRRRRRPDRARRRRRHARLHVPRAGRGPDRRPRGRRLLARPDPVRVLGRREPESPRDARRDGAGDRRPPAPAAPPASRPAPRAQRHDRRRPAAAALAPPGPGGAGQRDRGLARAASPTTCPTADAPLGLRLGAVAAAAMLGAWLALGHGARPSL